MEAASSCNSSFRVCDSDMERLLEAFGSSFSLESISSAYSKANRNVDLAGDILYELQGTPTVPRESKDGMNAASVSSLELSTKDILKHPFIGEKDGIGPANNYVSGIFGGEYSKSTISTNGSSRIQSSEVQSNESSTVSCSNIGNDDSLHTDLEDFLFRMLGDGFQLDMKMIHDVLGLCGYDLEKSMETLVDLSASTLEKSDDIVSSCAEKSQVMYVHMKNDSISEKSRSGSSSSNDGLVKRNEKKLRKKNNNYDLQREIMGSLFAAPERVEELPNKTSARSRSLRIYGRTPVEPVKETNIEETYVAVKPLAGYNEVEDKVDENSFLVLRQAVKENWAIMTQYYKAATDAYTKGDQQRANKLMKEGQFYSRKARKADEKSAQKLLETRKDEILLDISTLEPKEGIKLLKLNLSTLAGIPTIPYLKVFVGVDGAVNKKRLVLKLLEKESIPCTESENGQTIVIQLDEINPKSLSFTKK